jgi:hypothetical protein
MPAYLVTYRRPCPHTAGRTLTDSTIWVTPTGWDVDHTRQRFEAMHTDTSVLAIHPAQQS